MSRGRKAKPLAQKLLEGNAGKRALNHSEPEFSEITSAEPPEWLDDLARTMWELVSVELFAAGVLKVTDLHNVEIFCASYSRWRKAEHEMLRRGAVLSDHNGKFYKNPAATIANEAIRQIATIGGALGLDPAARTRLIGKDKGTAGNDFDEF